jgi:hypothetical protein
MCHQAPKRSMIDAASNHDALHVLSDEKSESSGHSHDLVDQQASGESAEAGIAAGESKAVRWIRVVATAVVVFSTVEVALAVYYYMTGSEQNTFEYRFKSDSYKILESIGSTVDRSLGSVDSFAFILVSLARATNQTFPFVVMPDFPLHSSKILSLSKGILFSTYIFVTHEQRPSWNNYSVNNDAWVDESYDIQEKALNKTYFGPIDRNWTEPTDIFQNIEVDFESDFYAVLWQNYPVIPPQMYSWDFWEYPGASAERMRETHLPTVSMSYNLPDPNDPEDVAYNAAYAEGFIDYLPPGRDPYEPFCEIYYVRRNAAYSPCSSLSVISWAHYFPFQTAAFR